MIIPALSTLAWYEPLFAPSGMQPMFYIIGFTFVGWISSSFRDKPWLLIVMGGVFIRLDSFNPIHTSGSSIVQRLGHPFHRGFYFSKNKIFLTIGRLRPRTRKTIRFLRSYSCHYCNRVRCNIAMEGQQEEPVRLTLLGLWT